MILNNNTPQLGALTTTTSGLAYYPLLPNSVVINAGTNGVLGTIASAEGVSVANATDEIGNPRVVGGTIDMAPSSSTRRPIPCPSPTRRPR